MAINRYSLADYTVKIVFPENLTSGGVAIGQKIATIGGPGEVGDEGSFVGEIKIERKTEAWTIEADNTGSWVHNQNLDRTGTVTLNIRQISDDVIMLSMLAAAYEAKANRLVQGLTITVLIGDTEVAVADDCYISKIPTFTFGAKAEEQTWSFNAGRITFKQTTSWPTNTTMAG